MALIDITPRMTSNTTPAPYVVSASSEYKNGNGTYDYAYNLFTNNNNLCWSASDGVTNGWIKLDFSTNTKIDAFSLTARNTNFISEMAKDIKMYGSYDDLSYTEIYSSTEMLWDKGETRLFKFKKQVNFRYYKFIVLNNNGYTQSISINKMNFYQDDSQKPTVAQKKASLITTLPHGSKLRLDNLVDDRTYLLATEDDGDNEGTLRMVNHAGKFIMPKASLKVDLIFDGIASVAGTSYAFKDDISIKKYKAICITTVMYNNTGNRNSVSQIRMVDDVLGKTSNDIFFNVATSTSSFRYVGINIPSDGKSFTVFGIVKPEASYLLAVTKVYGIY